MGRSILQNVSATFKRVRAAPGFFVITPIAAVARVHLAPTPMELLQTQPTVSAELRIASQERLEDTVSRTFGDLSSRMTK
jgi:hypothetical protein